MNAPPPGAQPYTAGSTSSGLAENMASALCYLFGFLTGILFLAIAPYNQNRNVRFHAWQAIFFNISIIAVWMVMTVLMFITPFFLDMILGGIWMLMAFGVFFLWLFLMFKAYNNDRLKLPVIGDLAEKQAG